VLLRSNSSEHMSFPANHEVYRSARNDIRRSYHKRGEDDSHRTSPDSGDKANQERRVASIRSERCHRKLRLSGIRGSCYRGKMTVLSTGTSRDQTNPERRVVYWFRIQYEELSVPIRVFFLQPPVLVRWSGAIASQWVIRPSQNRS
jgi:hypothetical protein